MESVEKFSKQIFSKILLKRDPSVFLAFLYRGLQSVKIKHSRTEVRDTKLHILKDTYRILGIDPGTNFLGYAVLEIEGRNLNLITMSILTLTHVDDPSEKLKRIFEKVAWAIDTYKPTQMAIEEPFYAKNVQSMLKLGRAQGVAMAAAMVNGLPVSQYLPKTVKKSVVGNGNASKEQVAAMLGHILKRPIEPSYFDASDALAVAVCHHYQSNSALGGGKKHDSWAGFLKANADRVKK